MTRSSKQPCRMTGAQTVSLGAGFCLSLIACGPAGEVLVNPDAHEDREAPLETVDEDPRCSQDPAPREEAWAIGDPSTAPTTGTLALLHDWGIFALPLVRSEFDVTVIGTVAELEITQVFVSPFDEPIEAVYQFPLRERAAVDAYQLTVGTRVLHGELRTRERAQEIYDQAQHDFQTLAFFENAPANTFMQRVVGIKPGDRVEVSIHMIQPLEQHDGELSLVLPTTVPAASDSCPELEVLVSIEPGLRPRAVRSKFHAIDIEREDDVALVELDREPMIANRDFVLSWTLGQAQVQAAAIFGPAEQGNGYFTLIVQPAERALTELEIDWQGLAVTDVYPRELPNLSAQQTLTVLGRYQGTPPNNIVVRGQAHGQAIEIPVHIELAEPGELTGVSSIWARSKLDELPVEQKQDIIALALQHGVVTEHTSFVTVGEHDMVSINASVQRIEHAQLPKLTPIKTEGLLGGSSTGQSPRHAQLGRPRRWPTVYTNSADIQALDVEVVRQVVNPQVHKVRRCYLDALETNSRLAGTVVISFTIANNGTVTQSTASSNDTGDEKLGKCIAKLAKDWTFPPGHGNAVVRYPFALHPG